MSRVRFELDAILSRPDYLVQDPHFGDPFRPTAQQLDLESVLVLERPARLGQVLLRAHGNKVVAVNHYGYS